MRSLSIIFITLVMAITGCANVGNMNTHAFVATPVPDEIRIVVYTVQTSTGINTWRLTNDDLRIRQTSKSNSGAVVQTRTRKMTPNDYNWVVYNLERANFTKVKSSRGKVRSRGNEALTLITQDNKYTYVQNSTTRFPNGFQKVVSVIPGLANPR